MSKNANADNDMWDAYKRRGKNFKGIVEDLEDEIAEESVHPREEKKRKRSSMKFQEFD